MPRASHPSLAQSEMPRRLRHNVGLRRNKYGVDITRSGKEARTVDGITFDSKAEARYYRELKLKEKAGKVLMLLTQVPIRLPGGVKYVCDFLVFYPDGTCSFVDVKGRETDMFKLKKKQVEDLYPIEIEVVK